MWPADLIRRGLCALREGAGILLALDLTVDKARNFVMTAILTISPGVATMFLTLLVVIVALIAAAYICWHYGIISYWSP